MVAGENDRSGKRGIGFHDGDSAVSDEFEYSEANALLRVWRTGLISVRSTKAFKSSNVISGGSGCEIPIKFATPRSIARRAGSRSLIGIEPGIGYAESDGDCVGEGLLLLPPLSTRFFLSKWPVWVRCPYAARELKETRLSNPKASPTDRLVFSTSAQRASRCHEKRASMSAASLLSIFPFPFLLPDMVLAGAGNAVNDRMADSNALHDDECGCERRNVLGE